MDYKKLGIRIKSVRKRIGYTQTQLAVLTGYSVQHISHIETGDTKLSVDSLVKIANTLEISLDQLLMDSLREPQSTEWFLIIEVSSNKEEKLI